MLNISNLNVSYGEKRVLKDLSLAVRAGEIVAVIGPNGAGKSTLVKAISGVLTPESGRIELAGQQADELDGAGRARLASVVPQGGYLPPAFTVAHTVLLGRTPYLGWLGRAGPSDILAVERALEETALQPLQDRFIGELSGGEQQRVLLARALAQEAPVLLLDEPTAHLDLHHQAGILRRVARLAREKELAVLMVVHDLNHAGMFADRVALLVDGQKLGDGSPEEVLTHERLSAVYGEDLVVARHPGSGGPLVLLEGGKPGNYSSRS